MPEKEEELLQKREEGLFTKTDLSQSRGFIRQWVLT